MSEILTNKDKELLQYLAKKYLPELKEETIPISIFSKKLSSLETIVKYLKENKNLRLKEISKILDRKYSTIANTYQKAKKKSSKKLNEKPSQYSLPISIFKNKKFSVLELIVSHLKNNYNLTLTEISELLQRNPKAIWTIYDRYKKK